MLSLITDTDIHQLRVGHYVMPQGLTKRSSRELSYDEFVETYGRISPTPVASAATARRATSQQQQQQQRPLTTKRKPSIKKGLSTAANVFTGKESGGQIEKSSLKLRNNNNAMSAKSSPREPMRAITPAGAPNQSTVEQDGNSPPPSDVTYQRRNSKIHNIANRLTRKSFRSGKRKGSDSSVTREKPRPARSATPTRIKAFFKRSQSVSRDTSPKSHAVQLRDKANRSAHSTPQAHNSPQSATSKMKRSKSYSTLSPSLHNVQDKDIRKRHSAMIPAVDIVVPANEPPPAAVVQDEKSDILTQILEQKKHILEEQERFRLRCSDASSPSTSSRFSPEKLITRKYESIREDEEMRVVAVVALLNRRKNSLKIKCDQFDRESSSSNDDRSRFAKEKLRAMRRKLSVVEQCIQEQKESMKVSVAKTELKCCIDLFQLGLQKDEEALRNGYRRHSSSCCSRANNSTPLVTAPSCETLASIDDTSVFGGSCASLLSLNSSPEPSPTGTMHRISSATAEHTELTNKDEYVIGENSAKQQSAESSGSCRPPDCHLVSDCDSGVDNGDTTSRSDISVDCALSKSTNSITSTFLPLTRAHSVTSSVRVTPSPPSEHRKSGVFFATGNRPMANFSRRKDACVDDVSFSQPSDKNSEVDCAVLAKIEDFQKYAEKTIRCQSNKGRLVPLKPCA